MELATLLETLVKIPNKNRTLVGFGAALGETPTPTTKTGTVKEIKHNPLALVSLPEMMMPWTFW